MPVTGQGSSRADNEFISGLLTEEVIIQNHVVISAPEAADYLLIGRIDIFKDEDEVLENENENEDETLLYVLKIQLQDNRTKIILVEQDIFYYTLEDISSVFDIVMMNIFSHPLEKEKIEDSWRNKWLYAKGAAAWTPRVYKGQYMSTHYANFGISFAAECQFLNFMSAELGVEITPDWILNEPFYDDRYLDLVLSIPILIKYIIKPSTYFMLEPYTGIQFNASLFGNAIPPLFSWLIGFQYGVKAGRGVFFVEPRVALDLGRSSLYIPRLGIDTDAYRRFSIYLGFGYKYGFFTRGQEDNK